jgi:hypothetical protein
MLVALIEPEFYENIFSTNTCLRDTANHISEQGSQMI